MKKLAWLTSLSFLLMVFGFSLCFWILPDRSFSKEEQRGLATFPKFSFEKLASGAFGEDLRIYFCDQFPLRDSFVALKGASEIVLGRGENNGILLENGILARRKFAVLRSDGKAAENTDALDRASLGRAADAINRAAQRYGDAFTVLLTGRNVDIYADLLSYPDEMQNSLTEWLERDLSDSVRRVETVSLLRERARFGEEVYYRTDHHWTTRGAYLAYCEILRSWGMEQEIIPEDAFERVTVSDSFYGSLWSAGGMKWVHPDKVELWLMGDEEAYDVTLDGRLQKGFYSMSRLNEKDHYSVFLDGVHDIVTVTRGEDDNRPTLLLIKDSFANSLAPFLARHFRLVLLNLSSTKNDYTDIGKQMEKYNADRVLLVYSLENVITSDKITRLR